VAALVVIAVQGVKVKLHKITAPVVLQVVGLEEGERVVLQSVLEVVRVRAVEEEAVVLVFLAKALLAAAELFLFEILEAGVRGQAGVLGTIQDDVLGVE
jgi:hypothetical protein